MSKIYITGIGGMLGFYLSKAFSSGNEVFGCDIVNLKEKIKHANFSLIDLTFFDNVEAELKKISPDVIIHTAAFINVDLCEVDKERAFLLNSQVTKNLASIADKIGAKLIYISTDAVFDGLEDCEYTETDHVNTINIYGESKLQGEKNVLSKNGNNLVLRTNIYGWNVQDKVSFAEWVYNSLIKKKEINMFEDLYYSPIYVGDLYKVINKAIEVNLSGLYHAAGREHCSKYAFAVALAEEFSLDKKYIKKGSFKEMSFKALRSANMKLDSSKIMNDLNIVLPNLKEGLNHFKKDRGFYE